MALGKAIDFIKKFNTDGKFRGECNGFSSKEEMLKKLDFNSYEFEDAINMQLVQCQTYEEADAIQEIKFWFAIL